MTVSGDRWEWIKPIMFSGGIGSIEDKFCSKNPPQTQMLVTKIGGPVYRIGVGGGAASSIQVQGINQQSYRFIWRFSECWIEQNSSL